MVGRSVSRQWQDWATLALGAWLFVSPWALTYTGTAAAWNAHIVGAGVMIFALTAHHLRIWEEITSIAAGVWLVVSPFVLGFASTMSEVALHTVVVGILATALAIWAMSNKQGFYKRWQRGHTV